MVDSITRIKERTNEREKMKSAYANPEATADQIKPATRSSETILPQLKWVDKFGANKGYAARTEIPAGAQSAIAKNQVTLGDISFIVSGRVRRISDGAMAALWGHIDIDYHGTCRAWVSTKLNPDSGKLTGNIINIGNLHPIGSAWIGACGSVTPSETDRAWKHGKWCHELSRGTILVDHAGNQYEAIADSITMAISGTDAEIELK